MSQIYPNIEAIYKVKDSRQMLLDRDNSIRTNFSGKNPPADVTVDDIGCSWFNTNDNLLYNLVSVNPDGTNAVWQKNANFSSFNTMSLGKLTKELLFVDLEGDKCDAKQDMLVLVEHTILPSENYELTNDRKRITFKTPIEAGLYVELRWFSKVIIGRDGKTFVPTITDKVLHWENDGQLPNPPDLDFGAAEREVVAEGNKQVKRVTDTGNQIDASIKAQKKSFDDNATVKTNAFNTNASNLTNTYNSNASKLTKEYNDNTVTKINAYNSNASKLTKEYNDNTVSKTNTFNANAENRQKQVDNSAEEGRKWAVGTLEERPEGSAKYYAERASALTAGSLQENRITNCIKEIPQDIKLELSSNGTLTLKTGSKVYIPNGVGKFDIVNINSDLLKPTSVGPNGQWLAFRREDNTIRQLRIIDVCSGDVDSLAEQKYHAWYDTKNNIIKEYEDDVNKVAHTLSLPFLFFKSDNNSVRYIGRIFNGFGYIGSSVFALPGVKGLIPNGRNTDGSLKNIEGVTKNVLIKNNINAPGKYFMYFNLGSNGVLDGFAGPTEEFYNPEQNYNVFINNQIVNWVKFLELSTSNGRITSFNPKTTLLLVDYNDFETFKEDAQKNIDNLNNTVVHKSGDETIGGNKIISGHLSLTRHTYFKANNLDLSVKPSETLYADTNIDFADSKNKSFGYIQSTYDTNQTVRMQFGGKNYKADGSTVYNKLDLVTKKDGNYWAEVNTPPASANGKEVATTEWINNATVHKTGNETINNVKTFTETIESTKEGFILNATHDMKQDTIPSRDHFSAIGLIRASQFSQGGDGWCSWIDGNRKADGSVTTSMLARQKLQGKPEYVAGIGLGINKDNVAWTWAPTPASNANGPEIATTTWVNSKGFSATTQWSDGGNNFWVKFSNGFLIQGGVCGGGEGTQVNLFHRYRNTAYNVVANTIRPSGGNYANSVSIISNAAFKLYVQGGAQPHNRFWIAMGWA